MKLPRGNRSQGIGALELIEEATCLLRQAPAEVLALYYLGTLPFTLALLYFWADMSRNADAGGRLAGASLGLALLFLWMKYWQARFCGALSTAALHSTHEEPRLHTLLAQAIFQPWGLVILPLALLVTIPFAWCFAFFQNLTVGAGPDLSRMCGRAKEQARLWQGQNHLLLCIFFLLGLVTFANLCVAAFLLPRVVHTALGIESIFTRSSHFLLNSTFLAAMAALTHLCVDPLVKASYLLRCHYGDSLANGADLLAELKEARHGTGKMTALLILAAALGVTAAPPARADAPPATCAQAAADSPFSPTDRAAQGRVREVPLAGAPAATPALRADTVDRSIEQIIKGPEFAWRLPRTANQKDQEVPGFLRAAFDLLKDWANDILAGIKRFFDWLADILPKMHPKETRPVGTGHFSDYLFPVMYALLAVCLSTGALLFWRQTRRSKASAELPVTEVPTQPDVADENVTADELSEDRWIALAKELLARGELRLALRALYLACLACLAEERLIAIARFKSNRDYERELGRFGHALPEVAASFSRNVTLFERAWYGLHDLEHQTVDSFMANYERIVTGVRQR